jgi:hypothetical protein
VKGSAASRGGCWRLLETAPSDEVGGPNGSGTAPQDALLAGLNETRRNQKVEGSEPRIRTLERGCTDQSQPPGGRIAPPRRSAMPAVHKSEHFGLMCLRIKRLGVRIPPGAPKEAGQRPGLMTTSIVAIASGHVDHDPTAVAFPTGNHMEQDRLLRSGVDPPADAPGAPEQPGVDGWLGRWWPP